MGAVKGSIVNVRVADQTIIGFHICREDRFNKQNARVRQNMSKGDVLPSWARNAPFLLSRSTNALQIWRRAYESLLPRPAASERQLHIPWHRKLSSTSTT